MKLPGTPTLLLDERRCRRNISLMSLRAKRSGVRFRPHFKTHQSRDVGEWFREAGVSAITVSSIAMARYFAGAGWRDITVAFPFNPREIDALHALPGRCRVNLLVESEQTVSHLKRSLKREVGIYIKVDTGYGRTGILAENTGELDNLVDRIGWAGSGKQPGGAVGSSSAVGSHGAMNLRGILTHAGDTYHASSPADVRRRHKRATGKMLELKERYISMFPDFEVSIGDTPGCSLVEAGAGVDEIRPGNFVFYDAMQLRLGSCSYEQIAVALACPVVAVHERRGEIVIHGGGIHLSKEFLLDNNGSPAYGLVASLGRKGWSGALHRTRVSSLSQEHGIISTTKRFAGEIRVGDMIAVIPVHSCMTANLMGGYLSTGGEHLDHFSARAGRQKP